MGVNDRALRGSIVSSVALKSGMVLKFVQLFFMEIDNAVIITF